MRSMLNRLVPIVIFWTLVSPSRAAAPNSQDLSAESAGFCRDGVYPTTDDGGYQLSHRVRTWGSYCKDGNGNTGSFASKPFAARQTVSFYVAGYAGRRHLPIYAENLKTG